MNAPVANSLASNSARKLNGGQALAEMLKLSGVGRDGGSFGLHAYSELQSIVWPG